MCHIICLCLPAVTRSEQQRFFTLFKGVLHAYGKEPGEMDLSLFFLSRSLLKRRLQSWRNDGTWLCVRKICWPG